MEDINEDGTINSKDRTIVETDYRKSYSDLAIALLIKTGFESFFRGVFGHDLINSFRKLL